MSKVLRILILAAICFGCTREGRAESSLNLEKIIVTPSKFAQYYKDTCSNVNLIEEQDISSAQPEIVTDVLDTLPSVDVMSYGSLGFTRSVKIRGLDGSKIVTLIDGRPVYSPRDGLADYNQIPVSNIERIEVMKGPASNIYGANAIGGVINIITKSGKEKMETELGVKAGSFNTRVVDFSNGWKIKKWDYFFTTNVTGSKGHRTNSDYERENYNLKLGYDLNDDNRLVFSSGYNASEVGSPGRNQDEDIDDRQEQWSNYSDLTWNGSFWNDSELLLKVYQNTDRLEFIESLSPILSKTANETKVYGSDIQLSQLWFYTFRTSIGVSGQENFLNSSSSAKHDYSFKAAYADAELQLFNDLTLKGGARVDDYSNFGSRVSPSASFCWIFFNTVKAHGLMAKSFRAPTFNDLYWPQEDYGVWGGVEGNPNLTPERAFSREIGISTFLFNKIETDVTYFRNKIKDMIDWTMDDTFWWRPTNVSTAVIQGVEANFNSQLTKALKLDFNYTRLSAVDSSSQKWIIYRPRHEYKGRFSYNFRDKMGLYLTGRYLTKRYVTTDNRRFLKGYFVTDAAASYQLNKFTEITLNVTNLLDRDHEEVEGYPVPGTAIYLGTRIKF